MRNQLCSIAYDLKLPGDACCICCCAHWCWFSGWARTSWCSLMLEAIATASTCTAMTPDLFNHIPQEYDSRPGKQPDSSRLKWPRQLWRPWFAICKETSQWQTPKLEEREKNREKTWYVNTYVYNERCNRYISYISEKCRIVKYSIV